MEIQKGIETLELCLYLKKYRTLVISDLHLGYEEALNKRGILIPRSQFKDVIERLNKILISKSIETIVITGDLKHEFGVISDSGWKNISKVIDLLLEHCKKLIIIKGNHDVTLPYLVRKKGWSSTKVQVLIALALTVVGPLGLPRVCKDFVALLQVQKAYKQLQEICLESMRTNQ